ncbi:MAG: LptA/OstA family protein [Candidatus Bipolaricaulia bacterium]
MIMIRIGLGLILMLLVPLLTAVAQPIDITAKRAEFNLQADIAKFFGDVVINYRGIEVRADEAEIRGQTFAVTQGNVQVIRDDTTLTSELLEIFLDEGFAVARQNVHITGLLENEAGEQNQFDLDAPLVKIFLDSESFEAQGGVRFSSTSNNLRGTSDQLSLASGENRLVLDGNAELQQGEPGQELQLSGGRITIDLDGERIEAVGGDGQQVRAQFSISTEQE